MSIQADVLAARAWAGKHVRVPGMRPGSKHSTLLAVGVERFVYSSFVGAAPGATFTFARDHWHTEEHIRSTGVDFAFLRGNVYTDVIPWVVGTDGVIRGPAGDGRVAAVARNDLADVAVSVLLGEAHRGVAYSENYRHLLLA